MDGASADASARAIAGSGLSASAFVFVVMGGMPACHFTESVAAALVTKQRRVHFTQDEDGWIDLGAPCLYEKVGFELVATPPVLLIGESTQFPG